MRNVAGGLPIAGSLRNVIPSHPCVACLCVFARRQAPRLVVAAYGKVRLTPRFRRALACCVLTLRIFFVVSLTGCTQLGYYVQAISGHFEIMANRKSIETLLTRPDVAPDLKQKLAMVLEIREFASLELGLPQNGSYTSFVDLGRPYALWNVIATPELSIDPYEWCFPIAGCVTYRGYFSQAGAESYAAVLRTEGFDVAVVGARAYSTLGWFDDSVLNTIVHYDVPDMAGLIFHELSHQLIYVADDPTFNESFATVVQDEGTRRWLEKEGDAASMMAYERQTARKQEFNDFILQYRDRLSDAYAAPRSNSWKRTAKRQLLAQLKEEYELLKNTWDGYTGYDDWIAQDLNNAHIASIGTYHHHVPALQALLVRHHHDLSAFYDAVSAIGETPQPEREAFLKELSKHRSAWKDPKSR